MKEKDNDFFANFNGNVLMNFPSSLISNKEFTSNDILVYGIINALSYKTGVCFAKNETLAKYCHMASKTTIQTSINKLVKANYLRKENKLVNGFKKRFLYTTEFVALKKLEDSRQEISEDDYRLAEYDWLNNEES